MKKLTSLTMAVLLAGQMSVPAFADSQNIERITGNSLSETSHKVSEKVNSHTYVIASVENFADALSSYNLVKKYNAKLILIDGEYDLGPLYAKGKNSTAYIVGGESVLHKNVMSEAKARFDRAIRVSGRTRYDTNRETLKISNFKRVGLASGENFADALSASGYLAKNNLGLALTKPNQKYIEKDGIRAVATFGGPASIKYGFGKRFSGHTRYDTAFEINKAVNPRVLAIADGTIFQDALSATNLISAYGSNVGIMLANNRGFNKSQLDFAKKADKIFVIGNVNNPIITDNYDPAPAPNPRPDPKPEPTPTPLPKPQPQPTDVNKKAISIMERITSGDGSAAKEIDKLPEPTKTIVLRTLEGMGYTYNDWGLSTKFILNSYDSNKSKNAKAFAQQIIKETGVNSNMNINDIINTLTEWSKTNLKYAYDEKDDNILASPYSMSIYRKSRCGGYSMLMSQIMFELKIPCTMIIGHTSFDGYHANNLFKINDKYIQESLQFANSDWVKKQLTLISFDKPYDYYTNTLDGLEQIYNSVR